MEEKQNKKRKKLGQNFLKNKSILKKIADNLEISQNDIVIEIGGGHGELTKYLTKARKLIVFEIDKNLSEILKKKFNLKNVEIRNENFLDYNLSYFKNNYKLVGNIPYSITGKIFRKILTKENFPQKLIFTLQKEVGEKILGKPKINFWSIWIKIWGKTKSLGIIKKNNFEPVPKVDSIIIKIDFYEKPLIDESENFAKFLKIIFQNPNKKLKHKLINLPHIFKEKRIFELNFQDVLKIYKFYNIKNV